MACQGNEEKLTEFFTLHNYFPPAILGFLVKYNHEELIMNWQNYWSLIDFNLVDDDYNTPLHLAILNEQKNLINWMLTKNISLTCMNYHKQSPFSLLKASPHLLPQGYQIMPWGFVKEEFESEISKELKMT